MKLKELIINKAALRRIKFVYLPFVVVVYLALQAAAFATDRPPAPPLEVSPSYAGKLPIVYDENYNIEFFGLEKLHPFDSVKYREILDILLAHHALQRSQLLDAAPPGPELMHLIHSDAYLDSLNSSWTLARIAELPFLRFFPAHLSRNVLLVPVMYQTGGSLVAAKAALHYGWAVNLGGGFHHASYNDGGGFCILADISLIVKYLREHKLAQKIMIIDLDAHQGNGYQRDFVKDPDVYMMDAYNKDIYPHDEYAKQGIRLKIELDALTMDAAYLPKVRKGLDQAFREFKPDLIIYNAGTDLMTGDPIGALDISPRAIVTRDELVFGHARASKIPIVMLLSGGYQRSNSQVIADSLLNLKAKFGLF